MTNAHVAPTVRTDARWYSQTSLEVHQIHRNDVVLDRPKSCGACTVTNVLTFKGTPYVVYACCGGERRTFDETVEVATPRLAPVPLDEPTSRHPVCRCAR